MKKKIVFIINSLNSGGAERVLSTLSNAMADNYEITIITFSKIKPFYPLKENIQVLSCKENILPSKNIFEAIKTNYELFQKTRSFCKNISPDIVIGFMTNANIISTLVSKSLKLPVLISERNNPELDHAPTFWRILRRFTYPKATKLIVQTSLIKNYYKNQVGCKKIKLLPNPISSIHTEFRSKTSKVRQNIILNVGRLSNQKGQEIAIKSFAQLKPNNWEFHIAGEGPNKEKLSSLIKELGMENKIKLIGRQKNISEYYLKSKIFVFPSRFEGFPNALTEAMYMGMASISTDCPTGPSELISHGINGYLIKVDDIKDLTKHLNMLIKDDELRQKIATNAFNSVNHLEEKHVVSQWKSLIEETMVS